MKMKKKFDAWKNKPSDNGPFAIFIVLSRLCGK